jgi:hypothetical protein
VAAGIMWAARREHLLRWTIRRSRGAGISEPKSKIIANDNFEFARANPVGARSTSVRAQNQDAATA